MAVTTHPITALRSGRPCKTAGSISNPAIRNKVHRPNEAKKSTYRARMDNPQNLRTDDGAYYDFQNHAGQRRRGSIPAATNIARGMAIALTKLKPSRMPVPPGPLHQQGALPTYGIILASMSQLVHFRKSPSARATSAYCLPDSNIIRSFLASRLPPPRSLMSSGFCISIRTVRPHQLRNQWRDVR